MAMHLTFKVWEDDLNLLYSDPYPPNGVETAEVVTETHNIGFASDYIAANKKHDHALWITCNELGDRVVDWAWVMNYRDAITYQERAYPAPLGSAGRAFNEERARVFLFQLIGDGKLEDEMDTEDFEPLPARHFEVDQSQYMGDGYWADYPPLEYDTYEEALAYVNLVNTVSQLGPNDMQTRGIRTVYKKWRP